jgi:DNA-binding NarL/FixJ family response regulator
VRRAVISAHALLGIAKDGDNDTELVDYISARMAGTNNYITKSLTRLADQRRNSIARDPVFAALPRAQREVVGLICMGKTNKEIAQLREVNEQTIKNMLTKSVFPAFGVSSRAALVSTCLSERFQRTGS